MVQTIKPVKFPYISDMSFITMECLKRAVNRKQNIDLFNCIMYTQTFWAFNLFLVWKVAICNLKGGYSCISVVHMHDQIFQNIP